MKKSESRDILLSVFAVMLLIIAITGITYAVYNYTSAGQTENVINSGVITMSYVESNTNVITINNALPTSDEIGIIQKDYFDFTLSATISGISEIQYKIWAKSIPTENQLTHDNVRIYLEKENSGLYQKIIEPTTFKETEDNGMLLYVGSFNNTENKKTSFIEKYRFRMWLSESSKIEENSKSFKLKINVYANA